MRGENKQGENVSTPARECTRLYGVGKKPRTDSQALGYTPEARGPTGMNATGSGRTGQARR